MHLGGHVGRHGGSAPQPRHAAGLHDRAAALRRHGLRTSLEHVESAHLGGYRGKKDELRFMQEWARALSSSPLTLKITSSALTDPASRILRKA